MARRRVELALLAYLLLAPFFSVRPLEAQTAAPASGNPSTAEPQPTTPNQTLVQESREAAGEDNNDQFKKSAAVRAVAKLTGNVESAYWLCVVLNFVVIAAAIIWFARKSLPGLFRDRTAYIRKAMQEAQQASAEANQRLNEIEKRLTQLDEEIAAMRASAEKEGADEEKRIQAAAVEEARKVAEAAGQEVAAVAKAARRELTAFAADLAVTLASKQIHVDADTDQWLVRRFASQLSDGNPDSGKGKR
jgi:F-type H+-transporting ATPase subunit b